MIEEHGLYEGQELWGWLRVVSVGQGLEIQLRSTKGTRAYKWVPFIALQIVDQNLHFALNGPRVQTGVVDGTSTALKDEPA